MSKEFSFDEWCTTHKLPKDTVKLLTDQHYNEEELICRLNSTRIGKIGLVDGESVRLEIAVEKLKRSKLSPQGTEWTLPPPMQGFGQKPIKIEPTASDGVLNQGGITGGVLNQGGATAGAQSSNGQQDPPFTGERVTTKILQKDPRVSEILAAYLGSDGQFGGLQDLLGLSSIRDSVAGTPSGIPNVNQHSQNIPFVHPNTPSVQRSANDNSTGEKPLLIKDFIVSNIKYSYRKTEEINLGNNVKIRLDNKKKKPDVEDYTVELWNSANYRIVLYLMKQGASAKVLSEYVEYSSWISDYLDLYDNRGVFLLDEAHRNRVAIEKRAWNDIYEHDKACNLSKKSSHESSSSSNSSPNSSKKSKKGKNKFRRQNDADGTPICGNFNSFNGCGLADSCKYTHMCNAPGCGGKHPRYDCTKNAKH